MDHSFFNISLFNPPSHVEKTTKIFHPFPRLPYDVRYLIWTKCLPHQRLITLTIRPETRSSRLAEHRGVSQAEEEGNNTRRYQAVVDCNLIDSKLLRINGDSRRAVLRFYRVHITCYVERVVAGQSTSLRPVVVRFNPEYDILRLVRSAGISGSVFLSDVRAADPRGIGIRNLALAENDIKVLASSSTSLPPIIGSLVRKSVHSLLEDLRNVYLVCEISEEAYSSAVGGYMFTYNPPNALEQRPMPFFVPSAPLISAAACFENVGPDPRPITDDIFCLAARRGGLNALRAAWRSLLRAYGVSALKSANYRYMCFSRPNHRGHLNGTSYNHREKIESRKEALTYIRQRFWYTPQISRPPGMMVPSTKGLLEESAEQPPAVAAVGFWLFPCDDIHEASPAQVFQADLSADMPSRGAALSSFLEKNWPELCVFILP